MKISHYEKMNNEAIIALSEALKEENYTRDCEYLIIIRNVTDEYNVDFTHIDDGEWADKIYDQDCDIMVECANRHKDTKYITIFAKSYQNGAIEFINAMHLCVDSRKQ